MIIPIKCFTCNLLLSSKYKKYLELKQQELSAAEIFKELKVKRYCCKKILLSHVDLIPILKKD